MKTLMFFFSLVCCSALTGCGDELSSTAQVSQQYYNGNGQKWCSMTVINETQAITAAHCLPIIVTPFGIVEVSGYTLHMDDGRVLEIESYDLRLDRAVLKGDFKGAKTIRVDLTMGSVFKVYHAFLCGYPGKSTVLRCEFVTRARNEGFQACFNNTLLPGQSGGGVFSLDGTLIGVVQRVTEDGLSCVNSTTGMMKTK